MENRSSLEIETELHLPSINHSQNEMELYDGSKSTGGIYRERGFSYDCNKIKQIIKEKKEYFQIIF